MRRFYRNYDPDRPPAQRSAPRRTLGSALLCLVAALGGLRPADPAAPCAPVDDPQLPPPAYEICSLSALPPVFGEPELALLFAGLAPGQSLEVTEAFLRGSLPWVYLDSDRPGAAGGGGRPKRNEPRAVFVLHSDSPVLLGPVIFVSPALILHSLTPVSDGGLPRDTWTIAEGPYAPTVYGRARPTTENGPPILFVAYPQGGQRQIVSGDDRATLANIFSEYFFDFDLRR